VIKINREISRLLLNNSSEIGELLLVFLRLDFKSSYLATI